MVVVMVVIMGVMKMRSGNGGDDIDDSGKL